MARVTHSLGEVAALFLRLGELRYREGDESRAKDMFDRVLGLDPDNADAIAAIDAIDEGRSLF